MDKLVAAVRRAGLRSDLGFDLIRAYLGVALLIRGYLFVSHPELIASYLEQSGDWFWPIATAHYVGFAHLGGGLLLAVGLGTRLAAAVQVPILIGAVFFIHMGDGLFWIGQSLELSSLVLFLLLVFSVFGSGPCSLDYILGHTGIHSASAEAQI
jgi:uncharacterized membrane protein YphA (DoxX/SURF4 family)